jgi:hypothetical protein
LHNISIEAQSREETAVPAFFELIETDLTLQTALGSFRGVTAIQGRTVPLKLPDVGGLFTVVIELIVDGSEDEVKRLHEYYVARCTEFMREMREAEDTRLAVKVLPLDSRPPKLYRNKEEMVMEAMQRFLPGMARKEAPEEEVYAIDPDNPASKQVIGKMLQGYL